MAVFLGIWTISALVLKAQSSSSVPLRFDRNGLFQIAVFEDLHFGEAEDLGWGPAADVKSTKVMNEILDTESPQLVVLNGDLITGENTMKENSTHYIDQIVAPLVERNLPWASTYGNHDSQYNLSRPALYAREKRYNNSLTGNMVYSENATAGITNYYIPVYSSNPTKELPELILWFFDSRGGDLYQQKGSNGLGIGTSNWVDPSVAAWMRETNQNLTLSYGKIIPSLAFVHIPVNAFLAFQDQGVDKNRAPGINDDVPLAQEGVTNNKYGGGDIPFMKALLETKGLIAVFSGHDHGDDWCFKWDSKLPSMNLTGNGLNLCFGRHTGYGGYGTWTRGSRQILIREGADGSPTTNRRRGYNNNTFRKPAETWIRLENGNVSARVMLNATYGQDQYQSVSG